MLAALRIQRFLLWTVALVALTTSCAWAAATNTSDGRLDPTFGANGLVYLGWDTDLGVTPYDVAIVVLAPSDGSVVLVGNGTDAGASYGSYSAICIAKLTSAGAFDTSFGDAATPGQTKIHGGGASTQIAGTSAALQSDGKIVIAGNVYYPGSGKREAAVWRLNADGTPDTGFGFLGASFIDRGMPDQFDSANAVLVVQGVQGTPYAGLEGRIVVAGSYDFDPGLVLAQSWMFQLDTFGLLVPNDTSGNLGSNTFDWPECDDGYHDLTFSALRMSVQPDTGALRYFLAGNCIPRNGGATFPNAPFIAAVDSSLHLVAAFGNNDIGISTVANHDSNGNIDLASDSRITSLDVDANSSRIVFTGNYSDGTDFFSYAGALDAQQGYFDQAWGYGGAGNAGTQGGTSQAASAVLIDHTRGGHVSAIVGGLDACLPSEVCLVPQGQSFAAKKLVEGRPVPYCYTTGECSYQYIGEMNQGAYAMAYTQGSKVLLAGYVLFGPRSDFAVVRLQGGDEIFLDGFGSRDEGFQ